MRGRNSGDGVGRNDDAIIQVAGRINRTHYTAVRRHSAADKVFDTARAQEDIEVGPDEAIITALVSNAPIFGTNIQPLGQLATRRALEAVNGIELKFDPVVALIRPMHFVCENDGERVVSGPVYEPIDGGDNLPPSRCLLNRARVDEVALHVNDQQSRVLRPHFAGRHGSIEWLHSSFAYEGRVEDI